MTARDAIAGLMEEHRLIERLLDALEAMTAASAVARADVADLVLLLRRYADALHHAKEEDVLFPALDVACAGSDTHLEALRDHHDEGRRLVAELGQIAEAPGASLDGPDLARLGRLSRDYVALLREHIRMEDEIVYPMARARIRPAAWDDVEAACAEIDLARAGEVASLLERARTLTTKYRSHMEGHAHD